MDEIDEIRAKKMNELKQKASEKHATVELTDTNFSATIEKYPLVIVDFWAAWCMPCRMLSPTIEALAKDYQGKIVFGKLNTDQNVNTAITFGITSIPTLVFFKNGKPVDKIIGALPRETIEAKIKRHL